MINQIMCENKVTRRGLYLPRLFKIKFSLLVYIAAAAFTNLQGWLMFAWMNSNSFTPAHVDKSFEKPTDALLYT